MTSTSGTRTCKSSGLHRLLLSCAIWVLAAFPSLSLADETVESLELLEQNGIASDTASVIAYLQGLRPDPTYQLEIATLFAQLSSPEFALREAATNRLANDGGPARELLEGARDSEDLDLRLRSGAILRKLDSGESSQRRQALTLAALKVLRSRRDPKATPVLLLALGVVGDAYTRGMAAEALWASASPSQIDLLNSHVDDENVVIRSATLVAMEVAGGEELVPQIVPHLSSPDAAVRLAAARALIDRNPRQAVKQLVALAGEESQELVWQVDALLQMKTGHRVSPEGEQSLGEAWQQWSLENLAELQLDRDLGEKRLDLSAGRNSLDEGFSRNAESLAGGYGRFLYENDNRGKAMVRGGKFHLDGNKPEGDQRLYITSQRMIGRDQWPKAVEIRTKLGGELGNNFGWHVGVSVGRVKVLFHPGLPGGGFRAEATDDHQYFFGNENMSFEPVCGVMHEMLIRVTKTKAGAEFDVTIKGGKGGMPHRKKFSVTREQLGDYDRIGLERSGRTGGDALFDSVSIRLGP